MMAIVRFAAGAGRFAWDDSNFGNGGGRTTPFPHFDSFRPHCNQSQRASDRMSDERLKVLGAQSVIFCSDPGVFGTLAVQYSGFYFVEHDTRKFGTTSDDGRVSGDILKIAKHFADCI